jgi:hypothetical protein
MKTALRLSWVPFALALIGCGGHGSTSPFSRGKLDGDVFIVTEGAQNVKLGLVEVRVLPYGETKKLHRQNEGAGGAGGRKLAAQIGCCPECSGIRGGQT